MENNDRSLCGFLSDFEYAKAISNESSSSDPKTVCSNVKDRYCLTFDQGTPYFMPLEIHLGKRYTDLYTSSSSDEEEQNFLLPLAIPPLKYHYHHDQESLMWVALYIVFARVDWAAAQQIWSDIFQNSFLPSKLREWFFEENKSSLREPYYAAFHDQLGLD